MGPGQQNAYANGTIKCSCIVVPDSTHANSVKQAVNGTVIPAGISSNASRVRPDPDFSLTTQADQVAAIQGDVVGIYPPGTTGVDLVCGATPWAAGDMIMSDANGNGITCTVGSYFIARAQTTGVAGALCPVDVVSPAKL